MPAGEHNERAVRQAKLEISVTPRDVARNLQLRLVEALNEKRPLRQVVQKSKLYVDTESVQDQEVSLSDGDFGSNQRTTFGTEHFDDWRMEWLRAVCLSVESSRVEDEGHV